MLFKGVGWVECIQGDWKCREHPIVWHGGALSFMVIAVKSS